MGCLKLADKVLVFPDSASVIFRSSNDGVALVIESAGEDFVFVTFAGICTKTLNLVPRLC